MTSPVNKTMCLCFKLTYQALLIIYEYNFSSQSCVGASYPQAEPNYVEKSCRFRVAGLLQFFQKVATIVSVLPQGLQRLARLKALKILRHEGI